MKESTGLSKNKIKYLQALRQKKQRQKYNKFIVEGDKIALELLAQERFMPELIFATPSWIETHKKQLAVHLNKTISVLPAELKQVSNLQTPSGVLLVADIHTWTVDPTVVDQGLSLYLDGIRDPGNMGTIIRIADWFGLKYIFCSPDCVDVYMPKVVQSAMGAIFRVPVLQRPLADLVTQHPDLPIYGTVLDGQDVFQVTLPDAAMIVVGNEGRGISEEALALIPNKIRIPAAAGGGAESLNAAVATGIFCALFCQA